MLTRSWIIRLIKSFLPVLLVAMHYNNSIFACEKFIFKKKGFYVSQ